MVVIVHYTGSLSVACFSNPHPIQCNFKLLELPLYVATPAPSQSLQCAPASQVLGVAHCQRGPNSWPRGVPSRRPAWRIPGSVLRQRQEPLVHLLLAVLIEHARQLLLHAFGAFAPAPLDRERILYKGVSTDALQVVCRSTHMANSTHRRDSVTGTAPFAPPPTAWGATVSRVARRSAALRHSPRPLQLGAVQRHDLFAGSNWLPLWGTATLYSCTCAFAVTLVQPHPTGPQSIATGGCPTTL